MPRCDNPNRCTKPATAQLTIEADLLATVVLYDTSSKLARYCQSHAERLARLYNERTVREQTQLHQLGEHRTGRKKACAYCYPPEERRLRVVEAA